MALLQQMRMPAHIQEHSLLVAEVATYLARLLNRNSVRLDLRVVEAGALLHDIGKERSITGGGRHEELGARMLHEMGCLRLAAIVQDHVSIDSIRLNGPITESLLVNYADKRVKHDQVVSVEERFQDLIQRYAKTPEHRARLIEKLDLYLALERKIFRHLTITPTEPELMRLRPGKRGEIGADHYEWQEADSSVAGRRKIC